VGSLKAVAMRELDSALAISLGLEDAEPTGFSS
jgi:hypothetical protein